jgi:hypothetical protein
MKKTESLIDAIANAKPFVRVNNANTPYESGVITNTYRLPSGFVVGYCAETREWLKWAPDGRINSSLGRTRKAAAALHENVDEYCTLRKLNTELARYFNVAAVTDNGSPISTQVWSANRDDAIAKLKKWISPDDERWSNGKIVFAVIRDTHKDAAETFTRAQIEQLP